MKTRRKYGILVALFFLLNSRILLASAGVAIQRDENENGPTCVSIPSRISFPSTSTKRTQSAPIYDRALHLIGDTPFSRKLEEEELKEELKEKIDTYA